MQRTLTISLAALQDDNATVVVATPGDRVSPNDPLSVTGSSKREPGDTRDPNIALNLASARALRKMADRMEAEALGLIHQNCSDC